MKPRLFPAAFVGLVVVAAMALADGEASKSSVRIDLDETKPSAPAGKATATSSAAKPPAKSQPTGQSGKANSKAAKDQTNPTEPERKIEGMAVSRGERGYLGVKVDGGFTVSFYDKTKKPVPADVAQIVARWPVHYQPNDERALLVPAGDGRQMTSDKVVKPPYSFKLYLTLLKDAAPGGDPSPETYIIDFRQ